MNNWVLVKTISMAILPLPQGHRRLLKSGLAMKNQRRFTSAEGGEHEREHSPSLKGGSGDLPRENFIFQDVHRNDFNAL